MLTFSPETIHLSSISPTFKENALLESISFHTTRLSTLSHHPRRAVQMLPSCQIGLQKLASRSQQLLDSHSCLQLASSSGNDSARTDISARSMFLRRKIFLLDQHPFFCTPVGHEPC